MPVPIEDRPSASVHPVLWILTGIIAALELLFWAVDNRYVGHALSRGELITKFAFHDQLFDYALREGVVHLQLVYSFVSYAFLHGFPLHMILNMVAFLGLGHAITRLAGIGAFLAVAAVSAVGGALVFGLVQTTEASLVGASGVVFGLIGTLTAWQERALRTTGQPRGDIWMRCVGLVVLNGLMYLSFGGGVAWEAHLGGFVAGWLMAYPFPPRPRLRDRLA
ncbi:MAG: rhomboid family intramembrane serine protease [Paracoccaceae bacterium]